MAKGSKAREKNRDLEALALLLWAAALFLTSPFWPWPTGLLGETLEDWLYGNLGALAHLLPLGFFLTGALLYLEKPLKPLLRHLFFGGLLGLSLLPLLPPPLAGRLGTWGRETLTDQMGVLGLGLDLLLALLVMDLWRNRPPWALLRASIRLGVLGVRRVRLGLWALGVRRRLAALGRLYPNHPSLAGLADRLSPEALLEVEEALRAFLKERVGELEKRLREEERPLEPRLHALLEGLKNPVPGQGPLRDALEERRAALHLEAQTLRARLRALKRLPPLRPTLKGLKLALSLREERRGAWEETERLLSDLEARAEALRQWLTFLSRHPEAEAEGLKALLSGKPPPFPSPQSPESPKGPHPAPDPSSPEPPKAEPPQRPQGQGLLLPSPDLLDPPPPKAKDPGLEEEAQRLGQILAETLGHFGIQAQVVGYARGPSVTRYELLPAPGEKISRIQSIQNDLARALAVGAVRIEAPIPGKNTVGLEVPNAKRELVRLSEALLSPAFQNAKALLPLILGKSIEGEIWVRDLARMPHLLLAGSTGSGKSVAIHTLIASLLFKHRPTELRLLLIDPKMVELTPYEGIPHLVRPVVTDPREAAEVLEGAVAHMERRYRLMSGVGVRNLEQYNAKVGPGEALPYLVLVVDELADLMMTAPKEVEGAILRLAQMSRATGMHLILATQRPSVDILTSLIKVNIPARLAFAVASGFDSRTILDTQGAERLIGQGDALFHQPGLLKPVRLQVPYISEEEVGRLAGFLRDQSFEDRFAQAYAQDFALQGEGEGRDEAEVDLSDPLLKRAAEIVVEEGYGSVSRLQRRLAIGHARAGKLMNALEALGIVGPARGSKPREVLVTKEELKELFP